MTRDKLSYCTVAVNHFYGEMEYIAPLEEVLYRRVLVPVGARTMVGLVMSLQATTTLPAASLRHIIAVIDSLPLLTSEMAVTIVRCSKRFMTPTWQLLRLAIPPYYFNHLDLLLPPSPTYTILKKMQASPFPEKVGGPSAPHNAIPRVYNTRFMHALQQHTNLLQLQLIDYACLKDLHKRGYIAFTLHSSPTYLAHYISATQQAPEHQEHLEYLRAHQHQYNVSVVCSPSRQARLALNMALVSEILQQQGQILWFTPTSQSGEVLARSLSQHFALEVRVLTSGKSLKRQAETSNLIRWGLLPLIVSTRLGILLPFKNLRLIIIEDEHNPHHKHYGAKAIYCVREAALIRAQLLNIPVIMSSARLSAPVLLKTQQQAYKFLPLSADPSAVTLERLDTNKQQLDNIQMSKALYREIAATLTQEKQVLIFLNRIGYARQLSCTNCGSKLYCLHCKAQVTLVLKDSGPHCICRSCKKGSFRLVDTSCQVCGGEIELKTMGTEKVEHHLRLTYPRHRVIRIDSQAEREIASSVALIQAKAVDIIVTTSKLNRGITFQHVGLVCVLGIDHILVSQDLGLIEKTLGVILDFSQAAQARTIVQSAIPHNRYLEALTSLDYATVITAIYGELPALANHHHAYSAHILLQAPDKPRLLAKAQETLAYLKTSTESVSIGNAGLRREPLVAGRWQGYILVQADSLEAIYNLLQPLQKERNCRLDLVPSKELP